MSEDVDDGEVLAEYVEDPLVSVACPTSAAVVVLEEPVSPGSTEEDS